MRYCRATFTEKNEGERKSRSNRACDMSSTMPYERDGRSELCSQLEPEEAPRTVDHVISATSLLTTDTHTSTMLLPLLALSFIPSVFSLSSEHQQLVSLARSGNGVIKLNTSTWHQLTSQKRTWSAVIEYTALDPSLKCTPCK